MICSDCGFDCVRMTEHTLNRGSSVREKGEPVCGSCIASRNKMVREMDAVPNSLDQIKALRMRRGAA